MDEGFVETHLPCPDCGSSDALCVNGNGNTKCFSCGKYTVMKSEKNISEKSKDSEFLFGECLPIAPRGIHLDTCQKYGYYVGDDEYGNRVHIANYRNFEGELVGQKIRGKDKNFTIKGNITGQFFGQHLWPNGGKK